MSRYAEAIDAVAMYGSSQTIIMCDRNSDGALDTASYELHLDVASDEMDAYLLGVIGLPLLTPPKIFKKLCIDIANYNSAQTRGVLTEEITKRADYARSMMLMYQQGKLKVAITTDPTTTTGNANQAATIESPRTDCCGPEIVVADCGSRIMTSRNLRGII